MLSGFKAVAEEVDAADCAADGLVIRCDGGLEFADGEPLLNVNCRDSRRGVNSMLQVRFEPCEGQ